MVRAFRSLIGMAEACLALAEAGRAALKADWDDPTRSLDSTSPVPCAAGYSVLARTGVQKGLVLIAMLWSATGSVRAFWVTKMAGLPDAGEPDRKGLDMSDHGGRAYNY